MNPPSCRSLLLQVLLLLAVASLPARDIPASTPAALAAALDAAGAGDAIVLGPGTWTDLHLTLNRGGSAAEPLVLRAARPGETVLTGSSALVINAPYVTVDGLFFHQGRIASGSVIEFRSHHGIVRNTAVIDYNPADFATGYYWVFFNGDDNLIDRCYFKGKNNLEPLIGNALDLSRRNTVRGSYFKNIPFAEGNGREDIRVWGAGKFDAGDEGGAFFTIEGNLFDHADGEGTEIISLKSNHNQVLNNTVVATRGCINIRQGSYNLVRGNIILGQDVDRAEGLRLSGRHNMVQGNYVSGCNSGIRVAVGEYIAGALTPSYNPKRKAGAKGRTTGDGRIATYPQVRELVLSGNVTVDIAGPDLDLGFGYQKHWPAAQLVLIPEDCLIQNNRFVRPRGGVSVIGTMPDMQPPLDTLVFAANRYEGNQLAGGSNAYAPAAAGCQIAPLPADWTEAGEQAAFQPLTADNVGPGWVQALRKAGKFPMETDTACYRPAADEGKATGKHNR